MQTLLPAHWTVQLPAPDVTAISSFPESRGDPDAEMAALCALLGGVTPEQAEDTLNGHCETCAVLLASHVVDSVRSGHASPLSAAHAAIAALLKDQGWDRQLDIVFSGERRARADKLEPHQRGTVAAMWSAVPSHIVADGDLHWDWCAGSACERIRAAASTVGDGTLVAPLYVINYIWDGSELSKAEMLDSREETAQYSLHVVGLVLDGRRRMAYVCDPNGPLLPGGNMEFVHLPVMPRPGKPTTAVSRFDLDQRASSKRRKGK